MSDHTCMSVDPAPVTLGRERQWSPGGIHCKAGIHLGDCDFQVVLLNMPPHARRDLSQNYHIENLCFVPLNPSVALPS